jgi:hypothetical protein
VLPRDYGTIGKEADTARVADLVSYTRLVAPYDAIISSRTINTGDFFRPSNGDSTDGRDANGLSRSSATTLFVMYRRDKVMFVVGTPERYADCVAKGTRA